MSASDDGERKKVVKVPSPKWRKMAEVYRIFASDCLGLDFSKEAAREMYAYESRGERLPANHRNGFWVGKHWLNVSVAMWAEDIEMGLLYKFELYEDPAFKGLEWWLDSCLGSMQQGCDVSLLPAAEKR